MKSAFRLRETERRTNFIVIAAIEMGRRTSGDDSSWMFFLESAGSSPSPPLPLSLIELAESLPRQSQLRSFGSTLEDRASSPRDQRLNRLKISSQWRGQLGTSRERARVALSAFFPGCALSHSQKGFTARHRHDAPSRPRRKVPGDRARDTLRLDEM